jgi:PadR family transcriptional regulator, regulatory protein PadR
MEYQDLLVGFVRLHILHHAAEGDLYGQWMIDELARHGYKMSAGTLYPMLHGMERKGYLKSHTKRGGRTYRRFYRATPLGRKALALVRTRMDELFSEIGEKPKKRATREHNSPKRRATARRSEVDIEIR